MGKRGVGLASFETGGKYTRGETCARDYRFAEADAGIDFDGLGLGETGLDNEREKPEETLRIGFYAFQVHVVELKIHLRGFGGDIHQLIHALDEEIFTVR